MFTSPVFYKDFNRKTYVIGARLYAIGQNYMQQSNFINIASNYLEEFSRKFNLIAYGCKLISNRVVYVYNVAPDNYKLSTHTNGYSYQLRSSIVGKVFFKTPDTFVEVGTNKTKGILLLKSGL